MASALDVSLAVRIHTGKGSGASATRDTASPYASFGLPLDDLPQFLERAERYPLRFDCVHGHIGSGSDPAVWMEHVDRMLSVTEAHFPQAERINLGGGFRVARMPDEAEADIEGLGSYAAERFLNFAKRTGRTPILEIEPGSFVTANAGTLITRVLDVKRNPQSGWTFVITDGGMDANIRPLIYGARHPFTLLREDGALLWSEWTGEGVGQATDALRGGGPLLRDR